VGFEYLGRDEVAERFAAVVDRGEALR
jgi:hypothetical protein